MIKVFQPANPINREVKTRLKILEFLNAKVKNALNIIAKFCLFLGHKLFQLILKMAVFPLLF